MPKAWHLLVAICFGMPLAAAVGPLGAQSLSTHGPARGSLAAAVKESAAHPDQLAIGIDNETALIVRGGLAEVVGAGTVTMYDGSSAQRAQVVILRSGDRYDLSTRRKQ